MVFHLKYLQFILIEFDPAAIPTKSTMVRYFEKGLNPSIKAEIDQDTTHLDNYKELVAKAVRVDARASLQPSFYVQETDLQVVWGSRTAHTSTHKVQTQGAVNRGDDSKIFKVFASTQESEPSDEARKDKKKRHHRDKRDFKELKDSSTLASGVNTAEISMGGQRRRNQKDLSGVTCFNCNMKRHFTNRYMEPLKN